MTSRDIFNQCVSLMFGEAADRDDYAPFWTDVLNLLLAENFDLNNALRENSGKAALTDIPLIASLDENIDYEPIVLRSLLPLGGAGYLFMEDEPQIAAYYASLYRNMKDTVLKAGYTASACRPLLEYGDC